MRGDVHDSTNTAGNKVRNPQNDRTEALTRGFKNSFLFASILQ